MSFGSLIGSVINRVNVQIRLQDPEYFFDGSYNIIKFPNIFLVVFVKARLQDICNMFGLDFFLFTPHKDSSSISFKYLTPSKVKTAQKARKNKYGYKNRDFRLINIPQSYSLAFLISKKPGATQWGFSEFSTLFPLKFNITPPPQRT
jgi:hypothetical protein